MTRASGNGSHWLRTRLGSGGAARLRVLERVRESTPEIRAGAEQPLGFSGAELQAFEESTRLTLVASRFPWRGDSGRLRAIAWWGSALADIGAAAEQPSRRRDVLLEAAAFNLAVALFDSVVERNAPSARELVEALTPARTRSRLLNPSTTQAAIRCQDPSLDLIAQLFDLTLASAGRRFASRPADIDNLAAQLADMYRSEMGLLPDPFVAKSGPVAFIGDLAGGTASHPVHRVYCALAHFCRLWDDWQDLEEDLFRFAPNSFLGNPGSAHGIGAIGYAARGLTRVLGGRLLHRGIAQALASNLSRILEAARECDPGTCTRTVSLCRALLG